MKELILTKSEKRDIFINASFLTMPAIIAIIAFATGRIEEFPYLWVLIPLILSVVSVRQNFKVKNEDYYEGKRDLPIEYLRGRVKNPKERHILMNGKIVNVAEEFKRLRPTYRSELTQTEIKYGESLCRQAEDIFSTAFWINNFKPGEEDIMKSMTQKGFFDWSPVTGRFKAKLKFEIAFRENVIEI